MKTKLKFSISKLEKILETSKGFINEDYLKALKDSFATHKKLDKLVLSTNIMGGDNQAKHINFRAKKALKLARVETLRLLSLFNSAIDLKNTDSSGESKGESIDEPSTAKTTETSFEATSESESGSEISIEKENNNLSKKPESESEEKDR